MKICIVGLGLIGGSLAKALTCYTDASVVGMDKNGNSLTLALDEKSIRYVATDEDLANSDVVILAIPPTAIIHFLRDNSAKFGQNTLVVDICGIKRDIMAAYDQYLLPKGIAFAGMHPMAGREVYGYEHSLADLFEGASLIIVKDKAVDYDKTCLADFETCIKKTGFRRIVYSTAEKHDEVIAYTSQLAHIVSSSYIKSPSVYLESGYSAGSFRDLTRVAKLDEYTWSDLFLRNADNLINEIDEIQKHLEEYREVLAEKDKEKLEDLLRDGRERKEWSNSQVNK
jgi:prephenate dehydrogenase